MASYLSPEKLERDLCANKLSKESYCRLFQAYLNAGRNASVVSWLSLESSRDLSVTSESPIVCPSSQVDLIGLVIIFSIGLILLFILVLLHFAKFYNNSRNSH